MLGLKLNVLVCKNEFYLALLPMRENNSLAN
jgi:hypothetical protein